jgi:hypothetical protein
LNGYAKLHLIILIQGWLSNSQLSGCFSGGFGANKFQEAFNKNSAARMFGKQAATTSIANPMKDKKLRRRF